MKPQPPTLKARALRLLGRREYSRLELQQKLAPFALDQISLTAVLDELQDKGFISEQRVLESVLHQRSANYGSARIKHELQQKGLKTEAISQALLALQDTELARASNLWQRRFGVRPTDIKERARQVRFLLARGFTSSVVTKVLRLAEDD